MAGHCFMGSVVVHITTKDVCERVNAQLVEDNIKIKPLKPMTKEGRLASEPPTLQGGYCWELLECIGGYLDILWPNPNEQQQQQRSKMMEMWDALANLFDWLSGMPQDWDLNPGVEDTAAKQAGRNTLAEKAKELAEDFLAKYTRALSNKAVSVYHHLLVHHFPVFIARLGSIERFSGQAMEHSHQPRKQS